MKDAWYLGRKVGCGTPRGMRPQGQIKSSKNQTESPEGQACHSDAEGQGFLEAQDSALGKGWLKGLGTFTLADLPTPPTKSPPPQSLARRPEPPMTPHPRPDQFLASSPNSLPAGHPKLLY